MILITGSNGFVGSHLQKLLKTKKIEYITFKGDLLDIDSIEIFFENNPNFNKIIHLVGRFLPPYKDQLDLNVLALDNLLSVAVKNNIKNLIFTSTAAVYGSSQVNKPSLESDDLRPVNSYGLSKKQAEEVVDFYHFNHGLQYTILRLASIYGQGGKGVVDLFLNKIKNKEQITIEGDGQQTRNFIFVEDVCRAIFLSLQKPLFNQVFNIADSKEVSIKELVDILQAKFDFKVTKKALTNNNLLKNSVSTKKAEKELKFITETNLEKYIQNYA